VTFTILVSGEGSQSSRKTDLVLHYSVGVASSCGVDGPGFGRGGEIFRTYPDRPPGPLSILCSGYRVCFPGV